MKSFIRSVLNTLHLDLTKNLKYDRLTKKIIRKYLNNNSNCIDVGCHKGEILDLLLNQCSNGHHFAFEPIPAFFNALKNKYQNESTILPYALGEENGIDSFQYVVNAPAYSGLKKRDYDNIEPQIEEIEVQIKTMDDCIPANASIDFIKIDVEGGEFGVLKGSKRILSTDKPLLLFEFGVGASDFYNTHPEEFFEYLSSFGYKIYALDAFIKSENHYSKRQFVQCYREKQEYYFVGKI
ncbi:MAG: FkbM family methyltransferase [Brumimicrobium sp.]